MEIKLPSIGANRGNLIAAVAITALLVAVMCFGIAKSTASKPFRDSVLKGRLVELSAELQSDRNVGHVKTELDSILKIYGTQLTRDQKDNLQAAWTMLDKMQELKEHFVQTQIRSFEDEYISLMPKAQEKIQVAGASL